MFGPMKLAEKCRQRDELREQYTTLLQASKVEAQDAISLMTESVQKQVQIEKEKHGIIICEAIYGKLPPSKYKENVFTLAFRTNPVETEYIDVRIPVQALVIDSKLVINGGHCKDAMLGFYDCCYGEDKMLRITYLYKNKFHECEVGDMDAVMIPQKCISLHLLFTYDSSAHDQIITSTSSQFVAI